MTREEAIKIIDCYDIGFYDLSGAKIPADKLADAFDMAIESLQSDAVQGEWTHDGSMWENRWVCNKCGHKIFERQTNFCPNCGAVMKGGDDE